MKTKKPKLEPLPKLLKRAEKVFNSFIRKRDNGLPCISCGQHKEYYDAGHYVPVRGGSFLRFHEWNVNKECKVCNGFDSFHLVGYRKNLIDKIGLEAVKYLEDNRREVKKWTREELNEIIRMYGQS
jgi:hypothetical protein